jgi:UDP-N-acetylmuramyl pentapeptide synthase
LAAAAITHGIGLSLSQITLGLSLFKPYDKRMQVEHSACGIKVVNDTYNANPSSMLAALQALKGLSRGHKTIVVLGDMLELGKQSVAAHRYVGESVASIGFDYLFAVGSYAETVVSAARDSGMTTEQAQLFVTKDAIADTLRNFMHNGTIQKGDLILVKGSRGMRMEVIVEAIAQMAKKETV